jgi:hypothetical protein
LTKSDAGEARKTRPPTKVLDLAPATGWGTGLHPVCELLVLDKSPGQLGFEIPRRESVGLHTGRTQGRRTAL